MAGKVLNEKQCVLYARVSTEGQSKDGVSLAMQIERGKSWAHSQEREVSGIYQDIRSGKTIEGRIGFICALNKAIESHCPLVVYSISRASRSVRDFADIAIKLAKGGSGIVSLTENIDCSSACGEMIVNVLVALSQFERKLTGERTRDALAQLKSKGMRTSRFPEFGWRINSQNGKRLYLDAQEINLIKRIVALDKEGKKPVEIFEEIRRDTPRTWRGRLKYTTVHSLIARWKDRSGEIPALPCPDKSQQSSLSSPKGQEAI